jgi:hypothetical protein
MHAWSIRISNRTRAVKAFDIGPTRPKGGARAPVKASSDEIGATSEPDVGHNARSPEGNAQVKTKMQ